MLRISFVLMYLSPGEWPRQEGVAVEGCDTGFAGDVSRSGGVAVGTGIARRFSGFFCLS